MLCPGINEEVAGSWLWKQWAQTRPCCCSCPPQPHFCPPAGAGTTIPPQSKQQALHSFSDKSSLHLFFSKIFRFCLRVFRKTLPVFFSFVDSNPKPHLLELDYRSTSSQRNQRGTVPACKMAFTLCFVTHCFCFAAGEFMLFYSTRKAFKQVRL